MTDQFAELDNYNPDPFSELDNYDPTPKPAGLGTRAVNTAQALGRLAYDTPGNIASYAANLNEGSRPLDQTNWADQATADATKRLNERTSAPDANEPTLIGTKGDWAQTGVSIPFSVGSMGAALGAGGLATAVTKNPYVGYTAGAGAAGSLAYRADTSMFMNSAIEAFTEDYQNKNNGQAPSRDLLLAEQERLQPYAQDHGLWEALPEAAGSVVGGKIVSSVFKGTGNLAWKAGKIAAGLALEELPTETITQHGQHNTEIDAGIAAGDKRSFTSPSDVSTSFGEVVTPVLQQSLLMGGGGSAVKAAYDYAAARKQKLEQTASTGPLGGALANGGFTNEGDHLSDINPDNNLDLRTDTSVIDSTAVNTNQSPTLHSSSYDNLFQQAESNYGLPSGLLSTMGFHESGFNPNAVSPVGARGVMQFMPATAQEYGIDPHDTPAAIDAAGKKMAGLVKYYNGDMAKAVAAYNYGEGNLNNAIAKAGDNWQSALPTETQNYLSRILGGQQSTSGANTQSDTNPDNVLNNPADAAYSTQPENLNGSQESTSETQNASAQEKGPLLSTDALEQSGATSLVDNAPHDPLVSVIDRNTGTAFHVLQSDLDSNKDRLTKHSIATGKRLETPILRNDIVDQQTYQQELADQQQRQDEPANQQTETQAQDQTSADQSTGLDFQPTHKLNDGTPVQQIGDNSYINQSGNAISSSDPVVPIGKNGKWDSSHAATEAYYNPKSKDVRDAWNKSHYYTSQDGTAAKNNLDHTESWIDGGGVTSDIGSQYDAHGIAKSNQLGALLNLLRNGINQGQNFDSAPLESNNNSGAGIGTASGSAYKDGAFIVMGAKGKTLKDGIHNVLVSDHVANTIPALKKEFPTVNFIPYSQAQSKLSTQGNNDTATETQSVLSNTLADATGVTAPTSTDVAGQASTPAAQEVVPKTKLKQVGLAITRAAKTEHRSIDGVGGAYHRSTNDSRRSDEIHSLTQTTDANGNPDYTAHISINTPIDGASNGTKTNEGKYSLNALLNSGAISQQTHDFLVDEYHGKNNDVIEANNNHQLTAEEYVSNNNAQFPNSKGINDSLRKSHYTDIRSHLDQGGKISQEVFDSLDGLRRTNLIKNYGEDIIDAEAIKQPSKTQATETVAQPQKTGDLSSNDQANKEPWELTKKEYGDIAAKRVSGQSAGKARKMANTWHAMQIRKAVAENKPISQEVLADYPDLKAPVQETANPIQDTTEVSKKGENVDTDYANKSNEELYAIHDASQSIKEKDAVSKILSNRRADEIASNLKPLEQKQQEQSSQAASENLYKDIVKQKTYNFKQLYTLATKHNTTVDALVNNQDVSKFSVTKVKNEKHVAMFHVKDNATATESVDTAKPEWHIDIPEHGLSILPAELKGEGYRTVAGRIAKDAVDAITQNQKIANDTLYLYFLPAAENHNAIARYFPEDQKPGSPWQISDSQGVRVGSLTNDQLLYKTESFMGNEPILGWEKTPVNTAATKQEEVASTLKPALGNYIQPKATASAEDQKRLASRGSRIATLSGINEAVRNSNPDYAYSDSEIQSAADDKIDAGIDWLISKQKPSVNKGLTTKGTVVADKAESNIQDFGEKLEGAKKFTYTFKEALSEDIDIAAVPLSKSFPQPDYEKLIAGGINPQVAALIAQLRAEIPTKPSKSYRVSKWVAQVTAIREAADHLLSGDLTVEQFIQAGKDKDNYTKYMGDVLAIADSILPSQIRELGNFKLEHTLYGLHSGVKDVWKWSVINTASKSSWGKQFDTKEEAVAYIKSEISTENTKGESIAKFDRWTERGKPGVVFVGKKIASGKYITLKEFPASKEALNYTIEHNAELVELLKQKKKDKEIRRAENNQRVGKDYRNGKNVSAKEFTDAFGFRGVQFGNWVENDRRQQDLNNAYDGLIDLAEVLGIPPKALALNGELGLAFGARGTGGEKAAAAHYESNSVVINLTKKNGAGSLAHEWWHAVDNYFGKQESDGFLSDKGPRRAQILDGNKYRESTDSDFAVRKEVFDAWQGVTKAIRTETQLVRRSVIKDKTRSKNYYATITEMTARSFERYVIGKLEDQGYSNDYLANIIPESTIDAQEKIEESDYPFPLKSEMAAVNKAYDKLFDTLETKETEKGTILFSRSKSTKEGYEQRIEELFSTEKPIGAIKVLDKSDLLDMLGYRGEPLYLNEKKVIEGRFHHGLTKDHWKKIPEWLDDPAMIFDSLTVKGRMVAVAPELVDGKPVYIVLDPNYKLQRLSVQLLVNAYDDNSGNYPFKRWIDEGLLRFENEDKVRSLRTTKGLQLPSVVHAKNELGYKILHKSDLVKYRAQQNTTLNSISTTPVVNPHSKTTLNQAVTKAMDTLFGQGWTNRLMATGKFKMISAAEATGIIGKNAMFHKVWHGSPHDHNGFDSAYIDTGEGAQAFGWGHYFSDLKTVAEWYRDKLQNEQVKLLVDGKDITDLARSNSNSTEKWALGILLDKLKYPNMSSKNGLSEDQIKAIIDKVILEQTPRSGENDPGFLKSMEKVRDYLTELKTKKLEIGRGKLYEVDLAPKQDEYLDWDKPLSQQSDVVKAGLRELHKQLEGDQLNEYLDRINADWIELTGQELYQNILDRSHQDGLFDHPDIYDRSVPNDEASSHLLHSLGIRGIRYKAEQGQSEANNYVVFNDADVKIEVKYSKNGDVIAFYNPADDTTYLVHDNITQNTSDKALQGLMLHEIGVHALTLGKSNEVFKDILRRFEALKATNPKVQAAFNRVPKDTKAEDITEEALAYYLEENPKSSLAQRIVEWFRQAVRALGKTLPVLERAKFSQWANKLTEAELIGMATSALKSAPDSLQFDNVGRNREGIKLSGDNKKRLAPNGKPSNLNAMQHAQVRTEAFKKWFGDWEVALNNKIINEQIKQYENGELPANVILNIGNPSGLLQDHGIPNLPIKLRQSIIRKAVKIKHEIDFSDLNNIAISIQAPIAIFDDPDHTGTRIAITELRHADGNIMAAIRLNVAHDGLEINDIRSIHPKRDESIIRWVESGHLLGLDKTKGRSWLENLAATSSRQPQVQVASDDSILYDAEYISKSSKVVDENGEPLVVYHGTDKSFDSFDIEATAKNRTGNPTGIYLTPSKDEAKYFGSNVFNLFAIAANPYIEGESKVNQKMANTYAQILKDNYPNYGDDWIDNTIIPEFKKTGRFKDIQGAFKTRVMKAGGFDSWKDGRHIDVFGPNQIKSATENNGDFSQSNNSIKFSRSTPSNTPADNSAMRSFFAPAKGKQALGWLAGVFQRNHLIDFVAQDLPELVNYKLLSQAKDNFTNQRENKIGISYKEMMDKMDAKTMHELGRVQGMATRLVTFDPATADYNTPMTEEERAVYDAYSAMPEGAKEAYATMRKAYQDDLTEKKNALIERIKAFPADRETQAEIISTIQKHFDQFKEGVYFPLNRDGAVIVKATNQDGELVIEHVATQAAAYKLVQEMTAQGYDNTHIIGKDAYDRDLLAGNAANEMAALAHKTISDLKEKSIQGKLTESDFNDLFSEFNQLLINTLPDSSYRKHFIHRKGTLGESTDTLRAYAKTRTSAVKMIASLTYDHQIQDVLNNADKAIKEMDKVAGSDTLAIKSIVNELKLREAALKSTEINAVSQVLTSLGFMGALGFNIGSAAVNMLQVVGVALPELVGKHGYVEATKEISAAYKLLFNPANLDKASGLDITKNPQLTAIAKQAMEYLASIGKIDLTMTHDSIAAGKNPSYSSNPLTRAFGGAAKYSGYFFHVAEAANRQVTGMAAFNLAYQKNGGDFKAAIADAIEVIDRTQFDYGQGNRARYMMSNTARVLTLFKSYALGMSYFIGRNAYQYMKGETPEVRLQAKKTLIASMAMSFATAGLFGMPIGLEAFAAIGGVSAFKYKGAKFAVPGAIGGMLIFQALLAGLGADDEDELETEFRNWLTDNFDQTIAEWVTKGPARLLPIGDIASRTSLSELWWRSQNKQLEGTDQYNAIATALIGPIGSQVAGLFTAKKMYEDGQYSRMVESMSPAFLRNAIAANRMGTEGVTNLKGDKIIQRDLTPVELINKVIGFSPTVVTNTYDANSAIAKESTKHTLAKSHLVNQWMSGDATERSDLMKGAIKDFNESVPPSERITLKSLFKSMRSRKGIDKHTHNGLYLSKKQSYLRDIGRFNRQE